jgi:(S)-2-hydroxy-acid oxidase
MYWETGARSQGFDTPGMTWDYLGRLKSITGMKLVIKGIVTAEDAESAVQHGVDALIVSNHGGRAEASGWATLDSLPEVVSAVDSAVPVMIDSGFRRGTDIFKALALGADAVCIGRAYLWGLAAYGQAGVEKVLDILDAELAMVMGQMGTPALKDIGPDSIGRY